MKPTPAVSTSPGALPSAVPCLLEGPWEVELTVSGGFAGVERKLEVESSGRYQVEDRQIGEKVEGVLPQEALTQIEADLPAVCLAGDAGRPPACADCFQYSLEVTSAGAVYRVGLNDLSLPDSPAAPLVGDLLHLMSETLAP
jgi:hypothetical protein